MYTSSHIHMERQINIQTNRQIDDKPSTIPKVQKAVTNSIKSESLNIKKKKNGKEIENQYPEPQRPTRSDRSLGQNEGKL